MICRKQIISLIAFSALGFLLCNVPTAAADKSGVKPNVISLPSGPGSIEGMGESFEPQLNSGTVSYGIDLKVPPGRAGLAPTLALTYSSGAGNGPFGLGWSIPLPYLQRQTDKGMPFYTDWPKPNGLDDDKDGTVDEYDEYDRIIESGGEELVPTPDGSFRAENEGGFDRFERSGSGWLIRRKDGSRVLLGTTATACIEDGQGRTFRWLVESVRDTDDNCITFSYGQLDNGFQKYLTRIQYNASASGGVSIFFDYQQRPDIITDYRASYELKTAWRCTAIRVVAAGRPVRSYRLDYAPTNNFQTLSLLSRVTEIGKDGVHELPPAEFGYVPFIGAAAQTVSMPTAPSITLNNGDIDLLDINSDSLPDIIRTDSDTTPHRYYINEGPDTTGTVRWASEAYMSARLGKHLAAASIQLADADGDGVTDLLDLFSNLVSWYRIEGTYRWQQAGYITNASFSFGDSNVRMLDINNDKRADVVRTDGTLYRVWINLGTGKYSAPYEIPGVGAIIQFDRSYVRLADMNGDRLQDIVRLENNYCAYYPNKGWGGFGPAVVLESAPYIPSGTESKLLMADINGDGISDVIYVTGHQVQAWLNLGLNPNDHTRGRFASPFSVAAPYTTDLTTFRQADVNGNGSTDVLWNTCPGGGAQTFAFLDFSPGEQPYQIKTISNGIGAVTTINYRSSTEEMVRDRDAGSPWPKGLPFPVSVISQVKVWDGRTTYTTEYQYHNGYYDGLEKEFRGFAKADKTEKGNSAQGAPTLITSYLYDTGEYEKSLKGKPLQIEAKTDSGEIFFREMNGWTTRSVAVAIPEDDRHVVFPLEAARDRDVIEGNATASVRLQTQYEYDDYGNLTRQTNYGRVEDIDHSGIVGDSLQDRQAWDDERSIVSTWSAAYSSGRSVWILNRLITQEARDENGSVTARTRNYYDDEAYSESASKIGQLTKGHLTMTLSWAKPSDPEAYVRTVRNRYDAYGNIVRIYDPLAKLDATGAPSDPGLGHFRDITYDTDFHAFPVRETIHTGNPDARAAGVSDPTLSVTADYDKGFGVITLSKDFNGNQTTFGYDEFGRLTSVIKPGDSQVLPTTLYSYALARDIGGGTLINWVETRQRETAGQAGTIDSRIFYDGLGRKIMTRAEGETASQVVVSDTVQFNARKGEWKKYLPYFATGANATLDFRDPTYNSGYTEHQYDALGRETRIFQPIAPGATTRKFSRMTYEPLSKRVEDEDQTDNSTTDGDPVSPHLGCAHREVEDGLLGKDGKGRLRQVHEIVKLNDDGTTRSTPVTWTTTYSYDLLDNLMGYRDSQNNQKFVSYDALKRKTTMNDPDRGVMKFSYDAASNLLETVDAKGQRISYAYDGVNRLLSEDYHDEGLPFSANRSPDVAYHYDNPAGTVDLGDTTTSTALNTKGYLSWVKDLSGEEHTSYDARERVSWVVKRLPDPENGLLRSFKTAFTYDSAGRVRDLIYPDNDAITNAYNGRGSLETISGGAPHNAGGVPFIISASSYNPVGQTASCSYGNGVLTNMAYDERLRLKSIRTTANQGAGASLIAYDYTFDGASNIMRIDDRRPATSRPAGDPLRNTQMFQYDNLYRLTQARYSFGVPGGLGRDDGHVAYRYDRIGNTLAQTSDIAQLENGKSVTNHGSMAYGGALGTSGRVGRAETDPPGPHALTATASGRVYPYDANGNMSNIDGLAATWDFKDRLVALDNDKLHTKYTYDYIGRRVTKEVIGKIGDPLHPLADLPSTTVLYVDGGFEVREHGEAVKYVWSGDARVAQCTGTLTPGRSRVQRLSLCTGWNLVSLSISIPKGIGANPSLGAVFRWSNENHAWQKISGIDAILAGSVLFIFAGTSLNLDLKGDPSEGHVIFIPAGGGYVPAPTLDASILKLPSGASSSWFYNAGPGRWQGLFPSSDPPFLSGASCCLQPSSAFFVNSPASTTTSNPPSEQTRLRYYHRDHLGSTNLLVDAGGEILEESTFYPYGHVRKIWLTSKEKNPLQGRYTFTQKELDDESDLQSVGARYLHSVTGRFVSVDPRYCFEPDYASPLTRFQGLSEPKNLNCYALSYDNPITYSDPDGKAGAFTGAVAGFVCKGLVSGAFSLAHELKSDAPVSWSKVGLDALGGGAEGAISGAIVGFTLSSIGTGGASAPVEMGETVVVNIVASAIAKTTVQAGKNVMTRKPVAQGLGSAAKTGVVEGMIGGVFHATVVRGAVAIFGRGGGSDFNTGGGLGLKGIEGNPVNFLKNVTKSELSLMGNAASHLGQAVAEHLGTNHSAGSATDEKVK